MERGAVVIKHKGTYYLLFSSNCYCAADYAVGYATSTSPMGTFTKSTLNPILSNAGVNQTVSGPGHNTVVKATGENDWYIIYHSHVHVGNLNSSNNGIQQVNIDKMTINSFGQITVDGPTTTPQQLPEITSGIQSGISDGQLRIHPTLVKNTFNINHEVEHSDAILTLTSITGHTRQFSTHSYGTITVENLPSGCYQLELTDGSRQYRHRIIKK